MKKRIGKTVLMVCLVLTWMINLLPTAYALESEAGSETKNGNEQTQSTAADDVFSEGWAAMEPERFVTRDGSVGFRLHLTEWQARGYESGRLIILKKIMEGNDACACLWETKVSGPDENGVLTAICPENAIFVEAAGSGEILAGPIAYDPGEDGIRIPAIYWGRDEFFSEDRQPVNFFCSTPEEDNLQVETIQAADEGKQIYTDFEALEEAFRTREFTKVSFVFSDRKQICSEEGIAGFREWKDGGVFYALNVNNTHNWHFSVQNYKNDESVFAAFQITDTQGKEHSSEMKRVYTETVQNYRAVSDRTEYRDGSLHLECVDAELYRGSGKLDIRLRLTDQVQDLFGCSAKNLLLNGDRLLYPASASAYQGDDLIVSVPLEYMDGISKLYSLEFDLELMLPDYSRYGNEYVRLTFPEPIVTGVKKNAPLGVCNTEDGLSWSVYEIRQDYDGKLVIDYEIRNRSDRTKLVNVRDVAIGEWLTPFYSTSDIELLPDAAVFCKASINEQITSGDESLRSHAIFYDPLGAMGVLALDTIRFYYMVNDPWNNHTDYSEYVAELKCNHILRYESIADQKSNLNLVLNPGADVELTLEQLSEYYYDRQNENRLVLGLWFRNRTGRDINMSLENGTVNGEASPCAASFTRRLTLDLRKDTASFAFLQMVIPNSEDAETVTFDIHIDGELSDSVTISMKKGTQQ